MPAEAALIRRAAPPDSTPATPFVLIEKQRGALRIVALSPGAAALGLVAGLPLADARARVPDLPAIFADAEHEAALVARLVGLCRRFTPSVSADPPQGLILDIAGCEHLFSGQQSLKSQCLEMISLHGVTACGAIAGTPDAARGLARFGGDDVRLLPVEALGLGEDATLALQRSGLRSIGDLAEMPRSVLAARFGGELPQRLARLLEEEDPHITPARVVEPILAERRFAEPIGHAADVLGVIEDVLEEVADVMARRGVGGRAFALRLYRSDGHVARLVVESGAPTRDPARVLRLLHDRIESLADPLDPGFGYDSIDLAVPLAEAVAERQEGLDGLFGGETGRAPSAVAPLLDRMRVRYGRASVRHCMAGNSHVPERAAYLDAAMMPAAWDGPASEAGEPPLRPLTLLDPPQPVEVLAAVPDGPPRRFRWRGTSYQVVRQEGPERIAPEWWRRRGGHDSDPGRSRDYYRVEDGAGRRFWLFRHGLYGTEAVSPDWYVHGLFA